MKVIRLLLLTMPLLIASMADASEVSFANLILKKTYLKSSSDAVFASPTPVNAVSPTTVTCTGKKNCVLQIQFSTQISGLNPGDPNVFVAVVYVDGTEANVLPTGAIGFDSTSTGGASNVRAFTWITNELTPGNHTVSVQVYVVEGSAGSANRTLAIKVLQ